MNNNNLSEAATLNIGENSLTLMTPLEQQFYNIISYIEKLEKDTSTLFRLPVFRRKTDKTKPLSYFRFVKQKLLHEEYRTIPWNFILGIQSVFDKLKKIFTKKQHLYKRIVDFELEVKGKINMAMRDSGYCCGEHFTERMRPFLCDGTKGCVIYKNKSKFYSNRKLNYCEECYTTRPSTWKDDEELYQKDDFISFQFVTERTERYIRCGNCNINVHLICSLHDETSKEIFYCTKCRKIRNVEYKILQAQNLPQTACDRHVTQYLKSQNFGDIPELTIRLVSNIKHSVTVKESMIKFRKSREYTYDNHTLFAFFGSNQEPDICFFSVQYQLYGKECDQPNRNIAYISFIDTVQLLPVPSKCRTSIYQTLILGLFDYIKSIGYEKIILVSCPPEKGGDYIFNRKPSSQSTLPFLVLAKWYAELFNIGKEKNILDGYEGLSDHAIAYNWMDFNDIPYIQGDILITEMEAVITSTKLKMYKKEVEQSTDLDKVSIAAMRQLKKTLKKYNKNYFIIYLSKSPIINIDLPIYINNAWVNNRYSFNGYFYNNIYEFSSKRRAQYSTQMMLQRLNKKRDEDIKSKLNKRLNSDIVNCVDSQNPAKRPKLTYVKGEPTEEAKLRKPLKMINQN